MMNSMWFFFLRVFACLLCLLSLAACRSYQALQAAPNKTIAKPKAGGAELKRALMASVDAKKFTQIRTWSLGASAVDKFSRSKFLGQRLVAMRRSDRAVLVIHVQVLTSAAEADQYVESLDRSRAAAFKKNSVGLPLIGEEVWRYPGIKHLGITDATVLARQGRAIVLARQGRAIVNVTLRTGARKDSAGRWVKDKMGRISAKPLSAADFKFTDSQAIDILRQLDAAGFVQEAAR